MLLSGQEWQEAAHLAIQDGKASYQLALHLPLDTCRYFATHPEKPLPASICESDSSVTELLLPCVLLSIAPTAYSRPAADACLLGRPPPPSAPAAAAAVAAPGLADTPLLLGALRCRLKYPATACILLPCFCRAGADAPRLTWLPAAAPLVSVGGAG
jgi:hypothetical protein